MCNQITGSCHPIPIENVETEKGIEQGNDMRFHSCMSIDLPAESPREQMSTPWLPTYNQIAANLSTSHRLQRRAANLRERKRMDSINKAFIGLQSHLPAGWLDPNCVTVPNLNFHDPIEHDFCVDTTTLHPLSSGSVRRNMLRGVSKVEILRAAISYINTLYELLEDTDQNGLTGEMNSAAVALEQRLETGRTCTEPSGTCPYLSSFQARSEDWTEVRRFDAQNISTLDSQLNRYLENIRLSANQGSLANWEQLFQQHSAIHWIGCSPEYRTAGVQCPNTRGCHFSSCYRSVSMDSSCYFRDSRQSTTKPKRQVLSAPVWWPEALKKKSQG
ncbi:unnamed protein product [Calicophoron daubneyi]|uniref:BHLH domain-containing protein n=1 Tax=Calicophoron daubneyi TaxID=300641 RepID=A0AAV2TDA0_CALDB